MILIKFTCWSEINHYKEILALRNNCVRHKNQYLSDFETQKYPRRSGSYYSFGYKYREKLRAESPEKKKRYKKVKIEQAANGLRSQHKLTHTHKQSHTQRKIVRRRSPLLAFLKLEFRVWTSTSRRVGSFYQVHALAILAADAAVNVYRAERERALSARVSYFYSRKLSSFANVSRCMCEKCQTSRNFSRIFPFTGQSLSCAISCRSQSFVVDFFDVSIRSLGLYIYIYIYVLCRKVRNIQHARTEKVHQNRS